MHLAEPTGLSFTNYLKHIQHSHEFVPQEAVSGALENFKSLEQRNFQTFSVTYIIDYLHRRFLFVSQRISEITDYPANEFMEGGLDLFTHIYNEEDFRIFNEKIFRVNAMLLQATAPADRSSLIFSNNFRMTSKLGKVVRIMQRSSYITSRLTGLPLYEVGVMADISLFKTDSNIVHVVEQRKWVDGSWSRKDLASYVYYPDEEDTVLSKQEKNVLAWIAQGYSGKQIAEKLHLSDLTINTHRKNMLRKTNSRNVAQLINFALRTRII